MPQVRHGRSLSNWPQKLAFLALIPLVQSLAGCHNSCFLAISNPGGGTSGIGLTTSPDGCPTVTPVGTVQAAAHIAAGCEACSSSNQLRKAVVTLKGIELHASAGASLEQPVWQELLPLSEPRTRQFELSRAGPDGPVAIPLARSAFVPAGAYDLVRLRFASEAGSAGDPAAEENRCGTVGLHCAVMEDGRILPFVLGGEELKIRFSSEDSVHGIFTVLPESQNHLTIELTLLWSQVAPPGEGVRLLPGLSGAVRWQP